MPNTKRRPNGSSVRSVPRREAERAEPRMLAHVRKATILETLDHSGSVQVGEIAERLSVSEMTIRRDLLELEREGQLKRLHGGAVATRDLPVDRNEPSFDARLSGNRLAKERIAAAALPLLGPARTVALDVGSTTFLLAQLLRQRTDLHIFTNSLRIAGSLSESLPQIYVPGGRVRGGEMAVCGPGAAEEFGKLWFDIAFLGVSGVTAEGFFDYSLDDAELKRVYLRRSSRKVVLCDSSKFQRMSLIRVADFADIDAVVTDAPPPDELMTIFSAAGVDVVTPLSASPPDA
jgi:DeoR/GlpR family transcriptional regulator of sugar metabolism